MEQIALAIVEQFPTLVGLVFLAIVLVGELREMRKFLFEVVMTVLEQTDVDTQAVKDKLNGSAPK